MLSVSRASSGVLRCLLALLALAALPDCGARTAIELAEACGEAGETRACRDQCGAGTQTCTAGYWGDCQVPRVEVACSGPCGAGVRTCAEGKLGECVIPVATRSCSNVCGVGQQSCENEKWQACVVAVAQRECSSVCGAGHETCTGGTWGVCDAPLPKPPVLRTTVRDFHEWQSDFELPVFGDVSDRGMVEKRIGPDRKPVYAGMPTTRTTPSGKAGFDVWYNDTPGVNLSTSVNLQLMEDSRSAGSYFYESRRFFPIDDQLFGNEGNMHNYHFTLETHTEFVYRGGEVFSFSGDDDVWVFIADQLAIDLGGLHTIQSASVKLDAVAATFGMVVGQKYPLDLFFAERHTIDSDFIVHTTIADVGSCE